MRHSAKKSSGTAVCGSIPLPWECYPDADSAPKLDYKQISSQHLLFDLVYNPKETVFLQEGKKRGAAVKNGLEMLYGQAEAAWKIWTALP